MSRPRFSLVLVAVILVAALAYLQGPSLSASQNNGALHRCAEDVAPDVEMASVEWRAGLPSGWWCEVDGAPEDTYLFWWN